MLRYTWEKTSNPLVSQSLFFMAQNQMSLTLLQLRIITSWPSIKIRRKILLPRPKHSSYQRPIACFLYYDSTPERLKQCTELILDYPGGGFVAMSPEHHEERLRLWARGTGKPLLAVEYGKAPECTRHLSTLDKFSNQSTDPYPFAIDEAFDTYQVLVESGM